MVSRIKADQNASEKSNPYHYPFHIFDAAPPEVEIPTLQQVAAGTQKDEQVIELVLAWHRQREDALAMAWREANPERIKAYLSMVLIHISHPYGRTGLDLLTFTRYLELGVSNCFLQSVYQGRLLDAFGLEYRRVIVSNGFHGWMEARIEGNWEVFDSTSNVWLDRSAFDLLDGGERRYRLFYTPWVDARHPEARRILVEQGQDRTAEPIYGTPGTLRMKMPGLGIYFLTRQELEKSGIQLLVEDFPPREGAGKSTI